MTHRALIRRAHRDDAAGATRVAKQAKASWGYPDAWLAEWSPLLTLGPDYLASHDAFIADLDAEVVGVAVMEQSGGTFELAHLWVAPAAMGKGVGRRLLEAVTSCAAAKGAQSLRIESDPNAVPFYERMGAKPVRYVLAPVCGQPRKLPVLELPVGVG